MRLILLVAAAALCAAAPSGTDSWAHRALTADTLASSSSLEATQVGISEKHAAELLAKKTSTKTEGAKAPKAPSGNIVRPADKPDHQTPAAKKSSDHASGTKAGNQTQIGMVDTTHVDPPAKVGFIDALFLPFARLFRSMFATNPLPDPVPKSAMMMMAVDSSSAGARKPQQIAYMGYDPKAPWWSMRSAHGFSTGSL